MPAPDITTPSPSFEQIASGVAYSRTLAAGNSPTSWALSGGPSTLVINNSGVMSGSITVTVPTHYSLTATATNADGSDTLTWLIVVLPGVVGVAANGYVVPMDLDIGTRRLSLPGIGSGQPAGTPPGGSGDSASLATWVEGERFTLSLGHLAAGVLQAVEPNRVQVLWRQDWNEPAIDLHEEGTAIVETGAGATARYEVPVFLDPDTLRGILSGTQKAKSSRVRGYLQVISESANDARDYDSGLITETITALDEGDSVADTFNVVLGAGNQIAENVRYTVALELITPTDPGNGVTLSREVHVTWNGSAFVVGEITGDAAGTGTPSVAATWAATLSNTAITGDAAGFDVAVTTSTNSPAPTGKYVDILDTFGAYSDMFDFDNFGTQNAEYMPAPDGDSLPALMTALGAGSVQIGDSVRVGSGITATGFAEALATGSFGGSPSIEFRRNGGVDVVRMIFSVGTDVETVVYDGENFTLASYPPQPDYTNATVTCRVTGITMPENSQMFSSQAALLDIEASFAQA